MRVIGSDLRYKLGYDDDLDTALIMAQEALPRGCVGLSTEVEKDYNRTVLTPTTDDVTGTFGTDGGNDASVDWNGNTYTGNRTDSGDTSEVIVTSGTTGYTITFEVNLNTGAWTATVAGVGISSSSGSGTSSFGGGDPPQPLNITAGTITIVQPVVTNYDWVVVIWYGMTLKMKD